MQHSISEWRISLPISTDFLLRATNDIKLYQIVYSHQLREMLSSIVMLRRLQGLGILHKMYWHQPRWHCISSLTYGIGVITDSSIGLHGDLHASAERRRRDR